MKKWTAAALSAAMVIGSVPAAAVAEDTELVTATATEIGFLISGPNDESLEAMIAAVNGEDGTVSISAGVSVSAELAETEEPLEFILEDLIRFSDGTTYVNVELVLGLYQELAGDASLTMLATMAGIDQPWLEIPALEVEDTETVLPEISEALETAFMDSFAPFEMEEMEDGTMITFDGTDVVSVVKSLKALADTYTEELAALIISLSSDREAVDYKVVFDDYIQAVAEGINAADQTITVDEAVEEIYAMIDEQLMLEAETEEVTPEMLIDLYKEEVEDFDEVIAEMEAALNEETMQGMIEAYEDGLLAVVEAADEEETAYIELSIATNVEIEYEAITAPEDTVLLRDVVKNAVIIYYSLMSMDASTYME